MCEVPWATLKAPVFPGPLLTPLQRQLCSLDLSSDATETILFSPQFVVIRYLSSSKYGGVSSFLFILSKDRIWLKNTLYPKQPFLFQHNSGFSAGTGFNDGFHEPSPLRPGSRGQWALLSLAQFAIPSFLMTLTESQDNTFLAEEKKKIVMFPSLIMLSPLPAWLS